MPSHAGLGSDFVSIVVADSTRIHTQLLADALRNDRGLQVVAETSLATVSVCCGRCVRSGPRSRESSC
jgi:hypothetical protein